MKIQYRIGNIVNYVYGNSFKQGKIHCLNYTTATIGDNFTRDTVKYINIKPIPLTELELEKLGVIKQYQENPFEEGSKWNKWFDEGNYTLNEDGSRWYSWVKGAFNLEIDNDGKIMFEVYSHYIPVDWVHQFQNLYYLLTNEELTYIK